MNKPSLTIVLPSYKEADNLKFLLPDLITIVKNNHIPAEILVIDTIYPLDDTEDICQQYRDENVKYVPRAPDNCYGDAVRTGIYQQTSRYILIMDADASHAVTDVPRLYDTILHEGLDVVIGSRYISGGDTQNGPVLKLMSLCLNMIFRFVFKLSVSDFSNSFRIYRTDILKKLNLECNNFDIVEEILIRLFIQYNKLKMKEIPILFHRRMQGESKRDLLPFIISYFQTIHRMSNLKKKLTK